MKALGTKSRCHRAHRPVKNVTSFRVPGQIEEGINGRILFTINNSLSRGDEVEAVVPINADKE